MDVALSKCKVADKNIGKRPEETTCNAVNFLSKEQYIDLVTLKINKKTALMVDSGKVLTKYALLGLVRDKMVEIKKGVQKFKRALTPLFVNGLPSFWDEDNKLIVESIYKETMIKARLYHINF